MSVAGLVLMGCSDRRTPVDPGKALDTTRSFSGGDYRLVFTPGESLVAQYQSSSHALAIVFACLLFVGLYIFATVHKMARDGSAKTASAMIAVVVLGLLGVIFAGTASSRRTVLDLRQRTVTHTETSLLGARTSPPIPLDPPRFESLRSSNRGRVSFAVRGPLGPKKPPTIAVFSSAEEAEALRSWLERNLHPAPTVRPDE